MDDNKSKTDDADTGNAPLPRYKVTKQPAAITDNPLVKVLDSIMSGFEGSWANAIIFVVIPIVEHQ